MALPAIDVFIPAIEKDLGTLPYVIDSVRRMVKHPIGKFMIVAPDTKRMRALCKRKGCTFIHENTVLPITKKNISYSSSKWERSGWLYQQLLKLGGDRLGSSKYYLVIDADTILIRPHAFLTTDKKTIFYYRSWSQPEYFKTYKRLMGSKASSKASFVTHYMLLERAKVAKLKRIIESKHGTRWYNAIMHSMNKKKQFAFSEFETYGNFLSAYYPGRYVLKRALNKSLSINAGSLTEQKRRKLAAAYRSISFHKRKAYSRQ